MTAMSGSFDNRRPPPGPGQSAGQVNYDEPVTGRSATQPPTGHGQRALRETGPRPMMPIETQAPVDAEEPRRAAAGGLYADARAAEPEGRRASAAIVPPASVTGRSLTLVISIMCFLACLTAGAVYMINASANAWLKDIASEVTVQIEPKDGVDTEKVVRDIAALLTREPGITSVKALSIEDSAGLLEPWLGQGDALKSLPLPRLIALELDRNAPPDFEALRAKLASQSRSVTLDDHRHWQRQIRTVTRSFALGGLGILLLVAAATTAIIVSATRSAMASNRDIVEVLHFVGATDRFIAREFETHFLKLGIRAGLVGAVAAGLVFLIAPPVVDLLGGGTVTVAEIRRLIGSGSLEWTGYLLLGAVVVVVAGLCMFTSRLGVYRILNGSH
jgi:cell division transport system permease protein